MYSRDRKSVVVSQRRWIRERDWLVVCVERNHFHDRIGDSNAPASRIPFRLDEYSNRDGCPSFRQRRRSEGYQFSDMDWGDELDPLHHDRHPPVQSVGPRMRVSSLIDIAHDHAAKDRATVIGVAWHGHDPQDKITIRV